MAIVEVKCPFCGGTNVIKNGKNPRGAQRYNCRNNNCDRNYFLLDYAYNGSKPGINEQIIKMTSNASGIRDTARVLGISTDKVYGHFKKTKSVVSQINYNYINSLDISNSVVEIITLNEVESCELDEMWSFVQNKGNQHWAMACH